MDDRKKRTTTRLKHSRLRAVVGDAMGFWFFGPVTWRWGGNGNPRSSVTVFGAFLTLPLLAWNGWNAWSALGRGEGSQGTPGHLEGKGMRNVSAPEKGSGE